MSVNFKKESISSEKLEIICGAPNIKTGILVPVAIPGATLSYGKNKIKKGEDLINIQQEIIYNDVYLKLKLSSWGSNRIEKFIQKSIIDG